MGKKKPELVLPDTEFKKAQIEILEYLHTKGATEVPDWSELKDLFPRVNVHSIASYVTALRFLDVQITETPETAITDGIIKKYNELSKKIAETAGMQHPTMTNSLFVSDKKGGSTFYTLIYKKYKVEWADLLRAATGEVPHTDRTEEELLREFKRTFNYLWIPKLGKRNPSLEIDKLVSSSFLNSRQYKGSLELVRKRLDNLYFSLRRRFSYSWIDLVKLSGYTSIGLGRTIVDFKNHFAITLVGKEYYLSVLKERKLATEDIKKIEKMPAWKFLWCLQNSITRRDEIEQLGINSLDARNSANVCYYLELKKSYDSEEEFKYGSLSGKEKELAGHIQGISFVLLEGRVSLSQLKNKTIKELKDDFPKIWKTEIEPIFEKVWKTI